MLNEWLQLSLFWGSKGVGLDSVVPEWEGGGEAQSGGLNNSGVVQKV